MIDLQAVLTSATPVTAIVQERIANGLMPQDYARPFVVWEIVTEIGEGTLACKPGNDDVRTRAHCYSKDAKQARQILDAVRDAIEDAYTTEVSVFQLYDPDTKLFHWVADFNAIVYR